MFEGLEDLINRREQRLKDDAIRYETHDPDECMLCHAHGPDMRSFLFSCFWDFGESMEEPIDTKEIKDFKFDGYYLRICKSCRSELIGHIQKWRDDMVSRRGLPMDSDGNLEGDSQEANIPVRINGAIKMITLEQWFEMKGEKESND